MRFLRSRWWRGWFLLPAGGCIFIDDDEHAAFVQGFGEGPADSAADSGGDLVGETGEDSGLNEEFGVAPVSELGNGVSAATGISRYGWSLAVGDVNDDGRGDVVASYLSDERPHVMVVDEGRFVGGAAAAGTGVGDAWFMGIYGNGDPFAPVAVLQGDNSVILAGDPLAAPTPEATGAVWMLGVEHSGLNVDQGGVIGEAEGDRCASVIATGPGFEVAVSAPEANCGTVYVGTWPFEGSFSGELVGDFASAYTNGQMRKLIVDCSGAEEQVDWRGFGESLVLADFTGTGLVGLVVGAPRSSSSAGGGIVTFIPSYDALPVVGAGEVYLSEAEEAFRLRGLVADGEFGASVAAADVNGDGSDDLIVGEPAGVGEGHYAAGAAYVFLELSSMVEDQFADAANMVVRGDLENQQVGAAVSRAGRGAAEPIAIGAPGDENGRGSVLITPAGDAFVSGPYSSLAGSLRLTGVDADGALGRSLVGGDLDNDGLGDVVMGAPEAGTGTIWLLRGAAVTGR